jgi:hypothetical protein
VSATVDDALVAQLARDAVGKAAPEELPLFRATSEAYFRDPSSVEKGDGSRDEMLGFGVDAALVLITPVALSVARDVLNFVVAQVRAKAREHGTEAVDKLTDRILKRGDDDEKPAEPAAATAPEAAPAPAAAELTDDQLEQVRALAIEKAKQLKLPDDKAQLLADSLVGSLATA